jgi:iron complex transport system ATP-binding protein
MKETLLTVEDLCCGYGKKRVLHDMSCTVSRGERIVIIGPNGCGKTTFLRAITGILKPQNGKILLEGKNLSSIHPKRLAQEIAVVSQFVEPVLMTVSEYIHLGRLPYYRKYQLFETRHDEAIVQKYMELTDLIQLKETPMNKISGGERQLVSIARALAQEPALLLLDEPTAHLDITRQMQILELIKQLNEELKLTVIMVLHDLNMASEYAGRLFLLYQGSIYKTGSPEEVLTYQTIEEVYRTTVVVEKSPLSGKPYIFLVTEAAKKKAR